MVNGDPDRLENHVVSILSRRGNICAKELHREILGTYGHFTIQGIYRVLRQLRQTGVIIKNGSRISLSLPWLLDLSGMVSNMQDTYLKEEYLAELLPREQSTKRIWTFNDLFTMNDFWSHLLIVIAKKTCASYTLHYSPHTWYRLLHKKHSMQCSKSLLGNTQTMYTIVGSKSPLDEWAVRMTQESFRNAHHYLAPTNEHIDSDRSLHIDVIGDYILTIKMDDTTTECIETLYKHANSPDDITSTNILPIYAHKAKLKIRLKKDPKKAGIYRKKFIQIFGPLEKK